LGGNNLASKSKILAWESHYSKYGIYDTWYGNFPRFNGNAKNESFYGQIQKRSDA
jgi:hypothetical protein